MSSEESMSNLGEFEEQLPDNFPFPEEHILEKDTPYIKECADRAGKAEYFRIDGMPVVQLFSSDGTYGYTYGYKDGVWSIQNVGNETFFNEGARIHKGEFLSLYDSVKKAA